MQTIKTITPTWPAPSNIHAFTTSRHGGYSKGLYTSFNLATHVGDDLILVQQNRELLKMTYQLPHSPNWLTQTHSALAVYFDTVSTTLPSVDAAITATPNVVCGILTADCLPILLCNLSGTEVAAIHAGWRGLAGNIITHTLALLKTPREKLLVWLGPAISGKVYEVGESVKSEILATLPSAESAFIPHGINKFYFNLAHAAKIALTNLGVKHIYGGEYCTYQQTSDFFSHRRDGTTGRMASLIWIA